MQVSSQHRSQVGQSHSISPSAPRGWMAAHRHRIGEPRGTLRSRRSMACRCPASGNHANNRGFGYGPGTTGNGDTSTFCESVQNVIQEQYPNDEKASFDLSPALGSSHGPAPTAAGSYLTNQWSYGSRSRLASFEWLPFPLPGLATGCRMPAQAPAAGARHPRR